MESEKRRAVASIPATRRFSSEKPRVHISAARAVAVATAADAFLLSRSLSGSFSSAGSVPIRAPLTVDEDDYSGSGTDGDNLASSDASNYSRELDSETDESVSGEADNEDVLLGGIRVHRVLGEELGGGTGDESDFSGGSVIYRPFTGDIDEETSLNYSSLEEESENSDEVGGISESEVSGADGVCVKAKVVIPRAILSLDDDDISGSDDEEGAMLARVTKPGSQFGDMGMVEEPECSGSGIDEFVSTGDEVLRMNYSDKLEDGLISFGTIEELNLSVSPGGSNEGNSVEAGMGLCASFKQHNEKEVVQKGTIMADDGCSSHEDDTLMKPDDAEGVEDSVVELGEVGMADKLECSGSITGELVSTKEDMQVNDALVSFETTEGISLDVAPRDCNDFLVESEGIGLDETSSQLVKLGVGEGCINKGNGSSSDADESMIPCEGPIALGRRESGDEDTGKMIGEAQERWEDDSRAVMELKKPECEGAPEIDMIYESIQLTPSRNSVTSRNLEVAGGIDVFVSGYGSSDQKAEQESENEGKQGSESEDTNRKLSLPYEESDRNLSLPDDDSSSNLQNSFETVEDGKQISEQVNRQVNFQSDSETNVNSLGIEETSLCLVKKVERILPDNSSVTGYDIMENESQMARLIHSHTSMELDEYDGRSDTREKLPASAFQNYFKELSSHHSVQLISEKVKERVQKTQLLKEKLQRIIRGGLCTENSAVTEVVIKPRLAGEEHQTSLRLDTMPDRTKKILPGQKFPDDLDFSINVLVIGKTGVGKSATVNSIFGETKSPVGAFGVTTKSANYVVGNVGGILVRILDTPGLMSSAAEERLNQEVLMSIKKNMKMFPVDVILYIGRLGEDPDIHLLRIITNSLGSSIWQNTIVVLTHAASDVPDSSSYEDFIGQRYSVMHQSIRQAVQELSCVEQSKMPEILLAENNMSSFCEGKTRKFTCPDWGLNLLILCCSVKIRSKEDYLRKPDVLGSPLRSFTLFCSLWNVLLLGANPGHASHLHKDLKEKNRHILDSNSEILWDKQSREECLEEETLPVKNQEPEDEERRPEEGTVLGRARTRRGRLGFQATKKFGIYLDTSELHTGFSIGDYRKHEEEEGRILVRMRGSMAVLGFVPMLMSVFNSVYCRKKI